MNRQTQNNKIPKLRFKEFISTSEWSEAELGSFADLIEERAGSREFTLLSVTSGVGLVSQKEKFGREIAGNQYKNYYVIRKWDFAYNKSATKLYPEGYIALLKDFDKAAVPNSIFTCFSIDRKIVNPQFLDYLFNNNFHGKWLRKFIEVGARAHGSLNIDNNILFSLPVVLPKLKEQKKIAACLISLDELIAAEGEKFEALRAHKKGLVQQLFTTEGETRPRLKFREFNDNTEWLFYNGDLVFEQISNKKHNSDLPILAITQAHGAIQRDIIDFKVFVTEKSIESYKVVEPNDFIISLRSFQGGIELSSFEGICSPAYIILRKKMDIVELFFKYYFKTKAFIKELNKNIEGIRDGKMVSYKQFSEILLPVPDSKEQKKIADCLSSLEELISAQSEKVEVLKTHKKGLMQQLFPSISNL